MSRLKRTPGIAQAPEEDWTPRRRKGDNDGVRLQRMRRFGQQGPKVTEFWGMRGFEHAGLGSVRTG